MKTIRNTSSRSRLFSLIVLSMLLLHSASGLADFASGFKLKGGGSSSKDEITKYYVVHKTSWLKSKYGRNYMLNTAEYEELSAELKAEARIWPAVIRETEIDFRNDSKIQDDDRIKSKRFPKSLFAARKLTLKGGPYNSMEQANEKLDQENEKREKHYACRSCDGEGKTKSGRCGTCKGSGTKPGSTGQSDPMKTRVVNRCFQLIQINRDDQYAKYYRKVKEMEAKRRF